MRIVEVQATKEVLEDTFQRAWIWQARTILQPYILHTPLIYSPALSQRTGSHVYLKMECWQRCGCFKIRGAIHMLSRLTPEEMARGLVTASSGNHGIALTYAAKHFGSFPISIFLPEKAEKAKVETLKLLGARVVFAGKDFFEAFDQAQQFVRAEGSVYIHSHAHPWIIAGQGTIGLEILEDLPDTEIVLVPIGGGGLISGISAAIKEVSPQVRIIGIEPKAAPGAFLSLREGRPCERIPLRPSLADGLLGGFSPLPYRIAHQLIERVELVEEEEIHQAMKVFQEDEQLMLEGSASVGLAAMLAGKVHEPEKKVVLVLTGRNIDAYKFNVLMNSKGECDV
jgi:threonine dehydratase